MSDFLLNPHHSLAHQGFVKILDSATAMPAVFAKPYAYDRGTAPDKKSLMSG
jgi:hypothetical protein